MPLIFFACAAATGCSTITEVHVRDPARVVVVGSCPAPKNDISVRGLVRPDYESHVVSLVCQDVEEGDGHMQIPLDDVESVVVHENPAQIGVGISSLFGAAVLGVISALAAPQVSHPRTGPAVGAGTPAGRAALLVFEGGLALAFLIAGIWELWPGTDRVIYPP